MSDILERAKAHFKSRVSGEMDCIDVPEWGAKIYFKPMNLVEQNKIYKHIREGSLEALVETLIVRARNEDGSKMFKPMNRIELMKHVDPKVIERICNEMAGDDDADMDVEGAEKNS